MRESRALRGRREGRVSDAPAASYAKVESIRVVTTGSPDQSGLPCAMVLTASFVLSPVIGLSCHRHLADASARLDASVEASGPHGFAVRLTCVRLAHLKHPPHPHPTFVTIAKRPSYRARMARGYKDDLPVGQSEIFSRGGLDTRIAVDPASKFFLHAHSGRHGSGGIILRILEPPAWVSRST